LNLRKAPLGKTGHRWEDSIKIDLKETRYKVMDWIHVAQTTSRL
jgi:hypothetical protein